MTNLCPRPRPINPDTQWRSPLVRDPITLLLAPRGQCRQWNRNKTKSVEENRNRYGGTRRRRRRNGERKKTRGTLNAFCPSLRFQRRGERTFRLYETRCIIRGGSDLFFELTLATRKEVFLLFFQKFNFEKLPYIFEHDSYVSFIFINAL